MVEDCVAALNALYSGGRVESVNYVSEDSVSLSQTAMLDHIYNSPASRRLAVSSRLMLLKGSLNPNSSDKFPLATFRRNGQ